MSSPESTTPSFMEDPNVHIEHINSTENESLDEFASLESPVNSETASLESNPSVIQAAKQNNTTPANYVKSLKKKVPDGVDLTEVVNSTSNLEALEGNLDRLNNTDGILNETSFYVDGVEYLNQTAEMSTSFVEDERSTDDAKDYGALGASYLATIKTAITKNPKVAITDIINNYDFDATWREQTIKASILTAARLGSFRSVYKLIAEDATYVSDSLRLKAIVSLIKNYKTNPADKAIGTRIVGVDFGNILEEIFPRWQITSRNAYDGNVTVYNQDFWLEASDDALRVLQYSPYCMRSVLIQQGIGIKRKAIKEQLEVLETKLWSKV